MGFRTVSIIKFKHKKFSKTIDLQSPSRIFQRHSRNKRRYNRIGIKSKPIKGEANKEIIKKIAKHFGIATAFVQIKSGIKSQEKIIEVFQ